MSVSDLVSQFNSTLNVSPHPQQSAMPQSAPQLAGVFSAQSGLGNGGSNQMLYRKTSRIAMSSNQSWLDPQMNSSNSQYNSAGPFVHSLNRQGSFHHSAFPASLHQQQSQPQHQSSGSADGDDVIPNAIVIKNIPFSVKREQLLATIEALQIPVPYALNFHFGDGTFRGLAFANFRSPQEASDVVAAMNGFDMMGRKLRVEYKKVLLPEEKDRIEREKALRRMASAGIDSNYPQQQLESDGYAETYGSSLNSQANFTSGQVYNDHQQAAVQRAFSNVQSPSEVPLQDQTSVGSYFDITTSSPTAMTIFPSNFSMPSTQNINLMTRQPLYRMDTQVGLREARNELDLNGAATLEIYSRVLLFKDDRMRDELAFSRSLTPEQRRTVHLVAQKLGVHHYSIGDGEERCVIVTRAPPAQERILRHAVSSLRRPDLVSNNSFLTAANSTLMNGSGLPGNSNQFPVTAPNSHPQPPPLRSKKSMPDMKRPTATLSSRSSTADLRDLRSKTLGPINGSISAQSKSASVTSNSSSLSGGGTYSLKSPLNEKSNPMTDAPLTESPPNISFHTFNSSSLNNSNASSPSLSGSTRQPRVGQAASIGFSERNRDRLPSAPSIPGPTVTSIFDNRSLEVLPTKSDSTAPALPDSSQSAPEKAA